MSLVSVSIVTALVLLHPWLITTVHSLHDGEHPLVVDYDEHYYYKSVRDKMAESLSVNNCSIDSITIETNYNSYSNYDKTKQFQDLSITVVKPPITVLEKWGDNNKKRLKSRIFTQVSSNLCSSKRFKEVKKGIFKRAKGCYKVYAIDKNGIRKKRFNDYGATLHPEHVRCYTDDGVGVCSRNGDSNGMITVPNQYRELQQYPFLVTANRAVIGRGGMFALPCGPFGLFASCEAVKWGLPAANAVVQDVEKCRDSGGSCPYQKYDKVFVMTQYDDTQIGQFMQEALPKLVYHLHFLQAHPEIKIHYGFTKQPTLPNFVLPHNYFNFLGLADRLINGTVYANKVYMPREGGCQDIGYNAWEALTGRETFLEMLGIHETRDFQVTPTQKPTVLVLTRSPGPYTQNKADYVARRWPKATFGLFLDTLAARFPDHTIEMFSDQNVTLMTCPLCQAAAFHRADVVIGMHGAGLSNMIYMRPNSVVTEVVVNYDSRHIPIVGIFPRLAGIVGVHHYVYYVNKDVGPVDVVDVANQTAAFFNKARMYVPL